MAHVTSESCPGIRNFPETEALLRPGSSTTSVRLSVFPHYSPQHQRTSMSVSSQQATRTLHRHLFVTFRQHSYSKLDIKKSTLRASQLYSQ